jgi:hypothetical protein
VGASDEEPVDAVTANTLRFRAVSLEPHFGQSTGSSAAFIERTSCSNLPPHFLHVYS